MKTIKIILLLTTLGLLTSCGGNNKIYLGGGMHGGMMEGDTYKTNTSNQELKYGIGQEAIPEKKQETVFLKEGDNYIIEITKIKKDIGGKLVEMLAYNGSVPGPIIKTKIGTRAKVTLVNKVIDLETTLHSHGLRLSDMFDGVVKDMKGKQEPIKYGSSFTYELSFPDEGVFWYHPHLREDIQQELGLYGNYIVEPDDENYYSEVNRESPIILDDIALNGDKLKPFYKDFTNYVLMGRFGNTMFLNGSANYTFNMKKGEVVKVYLTNVANTRVFNYKIPGLKMKLVGGDNGTYEKESFIDNLIISPGERYIVDLYAPESGSFEIQNATPDEIYNLGKVIVSDETVENSYVTNFETLKENKNVIADIDRFRPYFDKKIDKNLTLELGKVGVKGGVSENELGGMMGGGMSMGHGSNQDIEYEDTMPMMNKNSNSKMLEWKIIDQDTKKENMDINWEFRKGEVVKIKIENKKNGAHPMQHPFHLHGQRFLVIERNGEKQTNLVWKDTVLIKTGETIEIIADMSNSGEWMAHCHISEHLFSGMMMHFSVKE
ncbi:MAG: multicopper oxidase family protein [Candidatus Altimarinota bacterium]